MRKSLLIVLLLITLFNTFLSKAQGTWNFAAPTDGSGTIGAESAKRICVDSNGNVYMVGVFNGSGVATDFNLNSSFTNTFTASTNDGYIVSYDKNGVFRWKTIVTGTGSDFGAPSGGVCTDGTNVWVSGTANVSAGAATVISGSGTTTLTSTGTGVDNFIAKLNCSNGDVQWAKVFGGTGVNDLGQGICIDPAGNSYMLGCYSSTFTLDGVTAPTFSGTICDIFIAKFSPTGTLLAIATGGSTVQDVVNAGGSICYVPGATPAIVAVGHTGAATAAFGSFTGLANAGVYDIVLLELDLNLNFTNALVFGSSASDELLGAVYDPSSGGVFVSGFCSGNITFPGTAALTGLGLQDIVIARYSVSSNNFVWSRIAGGPTNDRGWSVAADGYGGIFLSGHSAGACSFGGSIAMPPNAGLNDLFVTRYNTSGVPIWIQTAIGAGSEEARSIVSYVETTPVYSQNIFVTGITNTTGVSFGSFPVGCDGGNDFFLAKLTDATLPLSAAQSQVNLTCNSVCNGSATVVASGGTSPYTYSWLPSGGSGATASSLCSGSYTCTITDAASSSITKTFTITQPSAITVTQASKTNVSCFGDSNGAASINIPTGGTGSYTYNWTPGNPTGDGTTSVTGLIAGTWTCAVTDANSCTNTQTFIITQPAAINNTVTQSLGVLSATQAGATYQWYQCPGTLLSGATSQTYTPTIAADYKVGVTLAGCTVISACTTVGTLGINNFELNSKIKIYPNPTTNNVTIELKDLENASVEVSDIKGRVLISQKLNNKSNHIKIDNLSSGMYLFKVNSNQGIQTSKVMKY